MNVLTARHDCGFFRQGQKQFLNGVRNTKVTLTVYVVIRKTEKERISISSLQLPLNIHLHQTELGSHTQTHCLTDWKTKKNKGSNTQVTWQTVYNSMYVFLCVRVCVCVRAGDWYQAMLCGVCGVHVQLLVPSEWVRSISGFWTHSSFKRCATQPHTVAITTDQQIIPIKVYFKSVKKNNNNKKNNPPQNKLAWKHDTSEGKGGL